MSWNTDSTHSNTIQTVISLLIFDAGRRLDHKRLRELALLNQDSRKRCKNFHNAMIWKRKIIQSHLIFHRIREIPPLQDAQRVLTTYMTLFVKFNSFKTRKARIENYFKEDLDDINCAVEDLDCGLLKEPHEQLDQHYYGPYWPSFAAKPNKMGSMIFTSSKLDCMCRNCRETPHSWLSNMQHLRYYALGSMIRMHLQVLVP